MSPSLQFDIAHLLAGGMVLVSFTLLYQDRMFALINTFTIHALLLAMGVAWQALIQDAPHLYVTAGIALVFKAIVIPVALHRIVVQLGIHREVEQATALAEAERRLERFDTKLERAAETEDEIQPGAVAQELPRALDAA